MGLLYKLFVFIELSDVAGHELDVVIVIVVVVDDKFDWIFFTYLLKIKKKVCLLYTSPSPRDKRQSRMPSSA